MDEEENIIYGRLALQKKGAKVLETIIFTTDDAEYEALKCVITAEAPDAEVFRAVMDGHGHYDHEYDIAIVAIEGARGMNTVVGISDHFRDTRIIWITSDKDFSMVAIQKHIYDFITRPYGEDRIRDSIRKVIPQCPNRHRYRMYDIAN